MVTLATIADRNMPSTAPPYLLQMPKLKMLDMRSVFFNDILPAPNSIDAFISDLYAVITGPGGAAFGSSSALPFHGISLRLEQALTGHVLQSPGGTFQPPSGYAQGTSNGSPASSREKLWVLKNQYQWICTYA